MKRLCLLITIFLAGMNNFSCTSQPGTKPEQVIIASDNVEVYYFHFSRRCATCMAVEANAMNAMQTLYPEQIKAGGYFFKAVNLDETANADLAKKFEVGGQCLLVVHGDKKVDITSQGFLYAKDPEKIKEEIRKAVEEVTKG
jgi:hypothetical protein